MNEDHSPMGVVRPSITFDLAKPHLDALQTRPQGPLPLPDVTIARSRQGDGRTRRSGHQLDLVAPEAPSLGQSRLVRLVAGVRIRAPARIPAMPRSTIWRPLLVGALGVPEIVSVGGRVTTGVPVSASTLPVGSSRLGLLAGLLGRLFAGLLGRLLAGLLGRLLAGLLAGLLGRLLARLFAGLLGRLFAGLLGRLFARLLRGLLAGLGPDADVRQVQRLPCRRSFDRRRAAWSWPV